MSIPTTGSAVNGRTFEITLTPKSPSTGTGIVLNCTGDIPAAPAMNAPSTEVQNFQGGDYTAVTVDAGYQSSTFTCEYSKTNYDAIDLARAKGNLYTVALGSNGFTADAVVTVSEGPTLTANGTKVQTMTVQCDWTSTKAITA